MARFSLFSNGLAPHHNQTLQIIFLRGSFYGATNKAKGYLEHNYIPHSRPSVRPFEEMVIHEF